MPLPGAPDTQTHHCLGAQQICRLTAGALGIPAQCGDFGALGTSFDSHGRFTRQRQSTNQGCRPGNTGFDVLFHQKTKLAIMGA